MDGTDKWSSTSRWKRSFSPMGSGVFYRCSGTWLLFSPPALVWCEQAETWGEGGIVTVPTLPSDLSCKAEGPKEPHSSETKSSETSELSRFQSEWLLGPSGDSQMATHAQAQAVLSCHYLLFSEQSQRTGHWHEVWDLQLCWVRNFSHITDEPAQQSRPLPTSSCLHLPGAPGQQFQVFICCETQKCLWLQVAAPQKFTALVLLASSAAWGTKPSEHCCTFPTIYDDPGF